MSAVSFASAGHVCQQVGGTVVLYVDGTLTGTIAADDETLVGYIVEDCAVGAFELQAFSIVPGSAIEIGTSLVSPAFSATYNRTPTTATLSNDDNAESKSVISSPTSFQSDSTYQKTTPDSVTWTLTADEGGPSDNAHTTRTWQARLYVGWTTSPGPYTGADILALNELSSSLSANGLFDVTLSPTNAPAGAYLVAAYHDTLGGAVASDFEVGNSGNGDVSEVQTGELVAIPGGTAGYSIARSDFAVEAPGGIRFARES